MHTNNRGFTLLEILVVVGIIAILAGILVFNLQGQSINVKTTGTASYIKTLEAALSNYFADFNTYPPSSIGGRFDYGTEILREALYEGINGTGKGDVRWKGPYMTFEEKRVGRVQGGQPSYQNFNYTYKDGTTPQPVDGVLLDLFNRPLVYIRYDDYDRIGAKLDTLATPSANETPYSFANSYQIISTGNDATSTPGELGGMSYSDNWDNDGDGFTDQEDSQASTKNNTLPEDDITR